MGIAADATAVQMRMLNRGKGPAVYALRAQSDKGAYHRYMKNVVENTDNLDLKQVQVMDIIVEDGKCAQTEHRFGPIVAKRVLYRGKSFNEGEVEYVNVEESKRYAFFCRTFR